MTSRFYDDQSTLEPDYSAIEGYLDYPEVPLEIAMEQLKDVLPRIMGYVQIAKARCEHPADGLTSDESASIYLYTMEAVGVYKKLNQILEKNQLSLLTPWFLFLRLFHTALEKLPSQRRSVWRSVNGDITTQNQGDFTDGKLFTWWRVTSCTANVKIVKRFMKNNGPNTLIMINCINGKLVDRHSSYPREQEIILLPGTQLTVIGEPMEWNDLRVTHLDEVPRHNPMTIPAPNAACSLEFENIETPPTNKYMSSPTDIISYLTETFWSITNSILLPAFSIFDENILTDSNANNSVSHAETCDSQLASLGPFMLCNSDRFTETFLLVDGGYYEGEQLNGKRHGRGCFFFPNGDTYDGEWHHDHMTGKGIWMSINKGKYEGDFLDGERHGRGVYTHPDGGIYDGQWRYGYRYGKGIELYSDGTVYDGDWAHDHRHGFGMQTCPSGNKYKGEFRNSEFHGWGEYISTKGTKRRGQWEYGKPC